MLEGIEILNTYKSINSGEYIFYIVICGLLFILFVVGLILQIRDRKPFIAVGIGFIILGLLLWASINGLIQETDRTYYKVIIDDSVSMNKFNERYEIYDKDGIIYTIYEKENK